MCARLKEKGLIEARWLTDSMGFQGTRAAIAAGDFEMRQGLPAIIGGLDSDPNWKITADTDIGDFVPFAELPVAAPQVIASVIPASASPAFVDTSALDAAISNLQSKIDATNKATSDAMAAVYAEMVKIRKLTVAS